MKSALNPKIPDSWGEIPLETPHNKKAIIIFPALIGSHNKLQGVLYHPTKL
jgi:hypothetical protein